MTSPPNCVKCGKDHWRFTRCEDVTNPKQQRSPHRVVLDREGERPWGDRLYSLDRRAGSTTFDQRSKPAAHGGRVTYPEGSDGPETT